jgi:hypothetical protein
MILAWCAGMRSAAATDGYHKMNLAYGGRPTFTRNAFRKRLA